MCSFVRLPIDMWEAKRQPSFSKILNILDNFIGPFTAWMTARKSRSTHASSKFWRTAKSVASLHARASRIKGSDRPKTNLQSQKIGVPEWSRATTAMVPLFLGLSSWASKLSLKEFISGVQSDGCARIILLWITPKTSQEFALLNSEACYSTRDTILVASIE